MTAETDRPFWAKPMTLALGLGLGLAAALVPQLPDGYRPLNLAAFGAVGLFVGARAGFWPGLALALGAKLAADLLGYRAHGYDPDYLPIPSVYLGFAAYPLLGRWLLRRTEAPLRVGGAALGASAAFFLTTNFAAWVGQALPYGYTLGGLADCYAAAAPFYRGTLLGDLGFTTALFGLHAALSRAFFPAERVAAVRA